MFSFFKKKSDVKNPIGRIEIEQSSRHSFSTTQEIDGLIRDQGAENAGKIIRDAAIQGNMLCQIFLSNATLTLMQKNPTDTMRQDFELFTKLAAEQGDPGSQFNLGLHYYHAADMSDGYLDDEDRELLEKAKHWQEKAAAQGFKPALEFLELLRTVLG